MTVMMKHEIIHELDRTSITTGLRNFVNRNKDAAKSALGFSDAKGRQQTRAVADKLYSTWRTYLGQQGKQGTANDLNQFIFGRFGGDPTVMQTLKQQFPQVFGQPQPGQPPGQSPGPGQPPGQQPGPGQPPGQPQQSGQQAPEISDQDSYVRFQSYQKRISNLLQQGMRSGTPDADKIMRSVNSMVRSFADPRRSDKARKWVKNYIDRNLEPHKDIVPGLEQLGTDPFASVPRARTRSTPPEPVPSVPPTPPAQPDTSQPPEFLRRQQNPPNPEPSQPRGPMQTPPAWEGAHKHATRYGTSPGFHAAATI